jgi:hypothetical protein
LTREPGLESWIKSWAGESIEVLDPEGWFEKGQGVQGYYQDELLGRNVPRCSEGTFL